MTPAGFGIVLRLIGHAQAGREPSAELALQQGPIPRFDGIAAPPGPPPAQAPAPAPVAASPPPAAALQAQGTGGLIRIPPLTPEKVNQYAGLFERQSLQGGSHLPGDAAKSIFEKSGLPNEVLGRIWQLADTEQRGALVQTEFVIAMHLLTSMKTGALRGLPQILPAGLYEAATRRGPAAGPAARQSPTNTGVSAIPRQLTGQGQVRTGSPLGRPPITAQTTGGSDWAVTPQDKARFDQIYADLDKTNKGYITGEEAVPFLSQSSLPEDTLAQIWDLADVRSQGQLNRDEFAVAMYLIRQQRGGRAVPLPSTLPANLMPPSLRNQQQPRPANAASAFDPPPPAAAQPAPPQPTSALADLFGLDSSAPSPAPPAPAQTTMSTGGSNANDPFAGGANAFAPSSPIRAATTGSKFPAFVPSSSFGRGLTSQPTGGSAGSGQRQISPSEDLLMDNDPESGKNLSGETAELANLSNQIGSLSKQMQDVQSKRTTTQNELNQATSQKANFEQRLAQLRTLYEKEAQDTRALEEQLSNARNETKKLQSECMTLEGTYQDIQSQHQQVLTSLQADQQENTNLRERIRVVNGEIAQLKPQIEKLKSEARQQKGLVAINKKQLSTTEGERDKLKTEAEDLAKSNEELSRQINTGSPVSNSAQIVSPAASVTSANNPFFRRTASTDIMGAFASPPAKTFSDKSFDEVFGPAFPPSATATPPPPAFKPQHTGASTTSVGSYSTPPASSPVMSRQPTLTVDPPAPPESRQINSSFLPFVGHTESLSSSRQVSPPLSRVDEPLNSVATPQPSNLPTSGSVSSLPGAFPGDESDKPEPAPAPTAIETTRELPSPGSPKPQAEEPAAKSPDPFGAVDEAKAKADFENAFAAFTTAKTQNKPVPDTAKSTSVFDTEFPPISELERDDDDDSDSSSDRGGFEDDFAPASPPSKSVENKGKGVTESSPPAISAFPGFSSATKEPESKEKRYVVTSLFHRVQGQATNLTSPEQPSSPATVTHSTAPQTSTVDDIFGAADTATTTSTSQPAPSNPPQSKTAFDDFDDEFEGLEDAKEGGDEEDFANISRSGLDDFNHVFDSSPPASQTKSDSTAFGNESSFDFVSAPSSGAPQAPAPGTQQKAADTHDWDAIFSGLDSPSAAAATPVVSEKPASPQLGTAPKPAGKDTDPFPNDDPILKNLTSMGYSRDAAVSALEKYDYNLERVSSSLSFSSL